MRIGSAYSYHPSLWLTARELARGQWHSKIRPEAEEGHDAAGGCLGRWLVVAGRPREFAHHDEDDGIGIARAVMIVEERVPGAGYSLTS
jgi:hypothetical protein